MRDRLYGYLAASWCVLFAGLHVFWALGGTWGLATSAGIVLATRRPLWFTLAGLWGVALVLLIGAWFAIGLTRWRRSRVATALGLLGGGLLLLRGASVELILATGAGGVREAVGPDQTQWSLILWNPWFIAGGTLLLLATATYGRAVPKLAMFGARSSPRTSPTSDR
ncbi:DUF3995 domain-containing protein [Pseudonocardiaceae bacterium YIM PH 21723]|nr:DUF3995 domain-containing protein [Pseudonocardiaceae bacterium YIM PH 21723]